MYSTDKINYDDGSTRRNHNSKKYYKKEEPFLCKECNRVWQPLRDYNKKADYLIEFPKLGCTIRVCYKCKKKGDNSGKSKGNKRTSRKI